MHFYEFHILLYLFFFYVFYLFSHEGSSQVHILNLNQTWQVTQAQGIKIIFDDQLIILKCHANIRVLAEFKHLLTEVLFLTLRVHSADTAWETRNISSNQVSFCRSDKQSYLVSSKYWK